LLYVSLPGSALVGVVNNKNSINVITIILNNEFVGLVTNEGYQGEVFILLTSGYPNQLTLETSRFI